MNSCVPFDQGGGMSREREGGSTKIFNFLVHHTIFHPTPQQYFSPQNQIFKHEISGELNVDAITSRLFHISIYIFSLWFSCTIFLFVNICHMLNLEIGGNRICWVTVNVQRKVNIGKKGTHHTRLSSICNSWNTWYWLHIQKTPILCFQCESCNT